jgi:hypothetical protein
LIDLRITVYIALLGLPTDWLVGLTLKVKSGTGVTVGVGVIVGVGVAVNVGVLVGMDMGVAVGGVPVTVDVGVIGSGSVKVPVVPLTSTV